MSTNSAKPARLGCLGVLALLFLIGGIMSLSAWIAWPLGILLALILIAGYWGNHAQRKDSARHV